MAAIELDPFNQNPTLDEEDESSEIDVFSDDSDEDPAFDVVEETRLKLSRVSIKKSRSRVSKEKGEGSEGAEMGSMEFEIPELDEKDGKCFEKVQKLIEDGQLEKLKVDQCKVYLRKYGLRLTGKKNILISRIREHLEVKDEGGEKKYPPSTFVLNCKGDSCTGDVVMFEQNVYEMYSIASRSATGPPCGTRTVAGRIVKESYGAAKQQHTFTIEVLWSKGEKPLPPLHPLLIKGRNLYRLMTKRQRWVDEEERRKVLQEKHTRGSRARYSRDDRIKEKEMRQTGKMKRTRDNKCNLAPSKHENLAKKVDPVQTQTLRPTGSDVLKNIKPERHRSIKSDRADISIIQPPKQHNINASVPLKPLNHAYQAPARPYLDNRPLTLQPTGSDVLKNIKPEQHRAIKSDRADINILQPPKQRNINANVPQALKPPNDAYQAPAHPYLDNRSSILGCYPQIWTLLGCNSPIKRQPLVGIDYHQSTVQAHFHENYERFRNAGMAQRFSNPHRGPWSSHPSQQRQQCPYYRQGRCYYAENCKYLHGDR